MVESGIQEMFSFLLTTEIVVIFTRKEINLLDCMTFVKITNHYIECVQRFYIFSNFHGILFWRVVNILVNMKDIRT